MEADVDVRRFKLILWVVMLWFFSLFKSCETIQFKTSGLETQGIVKSIQTTASRRGSGYEVFFEYKDKNHGKRTAYTEISSSDVDKYAEGQSVRVLYLSDSYGRAELADYVDHTWLVVLICLSLVGLGLLGKFLWEVRQISTTSQVWST